MDKKKGAKRTRNNPVLHDELKRKHTVWLTDSSWRALEIESALQGVSVSELVEKYAQSVKTSP
jgi:hypothetical protein